MTSLGQARESRDRGRLIPCLAHLDAPSARRLSAMRAGRHGAGRMLAVGHRLLGFSCSASS